jgi:hypothetical protein
MILYHFTRPDRLPSIMEHGLRAALARTEVHGCTNAKLAGGQAAVWLTEESDNKPSLEYRRRMLKMGILCGPKCRMLPDSTVCLRTVIPTHDRKLVNLKKFWRGTRQYVHPKWWFYLGDIPASRLTVFKHVPHGVTYWELYDIVEKYQADYDLVFPPDMEADLLAARIGPPEYVEAHQEVAS